MRSAQVAKRIKLKTITTLDHDEIVQYVQDASIQMNNMYVDSKSEFQHASKCDVDVAQSSRATQDSSIKQSMTELWHLVSSFALVQCCITLGKMPQHNHTNSTRVSHSNATSMEMPLELGLRHAIVHVDL